MANKKSFKDWVNGEIPVLVDFYAEWCGPCKMLAPVLEEFAVDQADKVKVLKVDIDRNQAFSQRLKVKGVPTLILYKAGKIVWRASGFHSADQLKKVMANFV